MTFKEFFSLSFAEMGVAVANDLAALGEKIRFSPFACYMIALLLAVTAGCLGYRYLKAAMGLLGAIGGFFLGVYFINRHVELGTVFARLPEFRTYLFGGLFALAFFSLAFRYRKIFFTVSFGAFAYLAVYQSISTKVFVCLAGAVIAVVAAAFLLKYVAILATAFTGGVVAEWAFERAFPSVQVAGNNRSAVILAGCFWLFCLLIQLVANFEAMGKVEKEQD